MENKIHKSLIQTNVKNILLAVTAINYYVLMISLVSLLKHAKVNMQFTILLIL